MVDFQAKSAETHVVSVKDTKIVYVKVYITLCNKYITTRSFHSGVKPKCLPVPSTKLFLPLIVMNSAIRVNVAIITACGQS